MLMEHAFSDEMNAQEDASNHHADDGWMGRIRAAIAGDEKAEPFHFKPQVGVPCDLISNRSPLCV